MAASDTPPGKGLSVPKNPALALRALNARHARGDETAEREEQESNTTIIQTDNTTNLSPRGSDEPQTTRMDGRTLRVRQENADRTMVPSMRLAVSTMEQLDAFCWRYRKRKQDVVQEALDLYFATVAREEEEDK